MLSEVTASPRGRRLFAFACLFLGGMSAWGYALVYNNKCQMDENLRELLMYTRDRMEAAGIPFWLEYGTLLGAVRDNTIVPWEFDIDVGIMEDQCENVLKLRPQFEQDRGFKMYSRHEYIPEKASFFGLVGGQMMAPCVRVYSRDVEYSMDIYWNQQITSTPNHRTPTGKLYTLADPYAPAPYNEELLCDYEAYPDDGGTGACRRVSDMFPLTNITMYGRTFPAPANSRQVLAETYGPGWTVSQPKGYKMLLCPPVWALGSGFLYLLIAAVLMPIGCYMLSSPAATDPAVARAKSFAEP